MARSLSKPPVRHHRPYPSTVEEVLLIMSIVVIQAGEAAYHLLRQNSHWDRYLGQMPRTPSTCPHDQFEEYDDMTSHRAEMNIENGEIN